MTFEIKQQVNEITRDRAILMIHDKCKKLNTPLTYGFSWKVETQVHLPSKGQVKTLLERETRLLCIDALRGKGTVNTQASDPRRLPAWRASGQATLTSNHWRKVPQMLRTIRPLFESLASRGATAAAPAADEMSANGAAATKAWQTRVLELEDELKAKSDAVSRLRQRELWFEYQLRRQSDSNSRPLEMLLSEARSLRSSFRVNAPS